MNCGDARQNLSSFFDGELDDDLRAQVADHVQSCAECAAALSRIQALSALAKKLPDPAPAELWPAIEHELASKNLVHAEARFAARNWRTRNVAVAAALAASLLLAIVGWNVLRGSDPHSEMAVNLSRYIEEFGRDPKAAEEALRSKYAAEVIEPSAAVRLVGYRPIAPTKLGDAVRTEMCVIDMPCCKCIQSLYRRGDGAMLAVFEHIDEQPTWFAKRPSIHAKCENTDVCLVQCDGQLAAMWKLGQRFVTLIGVKNLEELNEFVRTIKSAT